MESVNIFEEEFNRIAEDKVYLVLSDVLKMTFIDQISEIEINFAHIRMIV